MGQPAFDSGEGEGVFAETLRDVLRRTEGALAAALVANDGVPVCLSGKAPGGGLGILTAHLTDLLKRSAAAAEECGVGPTSELIQKTSSNSLLILGVTGQYSLLLVLDRDGSIGRGRWELRKAAELLRPELV